MRAPLGPGGIPFNYNGAPAVGNDGDNYQNMLEWSMGRSVIDSFGGPLQQSHTQYLLAELGARVTLTLPNLITGMFVAAEEAFKALRPVVNMTRLEFGVNAIVVETLKVLIRGLVHTSVFSGGPVQSFTAEQQTAEVRKYAAAYQYHSDVLRDVAGRGPAIIQAMLSTRIDSIRLCWLRLVLTALMEYSSRPMTLQGNPTRRGWQTVLNFYRRTTAIGRRTRDGLADLRAMINQEGQQRKVEFDIVLVSTSFVDAAVRVLSQGVNFITGQPLPKYDSSTVLSQLSAMWGKQVIAIPNTPHGQIEIDPLLRNAHFVECARIPVRLILESTVRLITRDGAYNIAAGNAAAGLTDAQTAALLGILLDTFQVSIVHRPTGQRSFFSFRQMYENVALFPRPAVGAAGNVSDPPAMIERIPATNIPVSDLVYFSPQSLQGGSIIALKSKCVDLASTPLLTRSGLDPESGIQTDEDLLYAAVLLQNPNHTLMIPPPLPIERLRGGVAAFISTAEIRRAGFNFAQLPAACGTMVVMAEVNAAMASLPNDYVPFNGQLPAAMSGTGAPLNYFGTAATWAELGILFNRMTAYDAAANLSALETTFPAYCNSADCQVRRLQVQPVQMAGLPAALQAAIAGFLNNVSTVMEFQCTSPNGTKLYPGCDQDLTGENASVQADVQGPAIINAFGAVAV